MLIDTSTETYTFAQSINNRAEFQGIFISKSRKIIKAGEFHKVWVRGSSIEMNGHVTLHMNGLLPKKVLACKWEDSLHRMGAS